MQKKRLALTVAALLALGGTSALAQSGSQKPPHEMPATPHQEEVLKGQQPEQAQIPGAKTPVEAEVKGMPTSPHQTEVLKNVEGDTTKAQTAQPK
jgi:hypothetical protein